MLCKYDHNTASAQQLDWEDVQAVRSSLSGKSDFNLQDFDARMFLHMCILLGVDYLEGLRGVGIIKANEASP